MEKNHDGVRSSLRRETNLIFSCCNIIDKRSLVNVIDINKDIDMLVTERLAFVFLTDVHL